MKKLLLVANLFFSVAMSAQIWSENFNSGAALPAGWAFETAATDGGWSVASPTALSSQYFANILESNTIIFSILSPIL